MALSVATLATTPYMIGNFSGFHVAKTRGEHSIFDHTLVRADLDEVPAGAVTIITPRRAAGGDTIYLSYFTNEISSVRMPSPPPQGVDKFLTDGLSGCMFFVDQINGNNDLIVYHANARRHSPPGNMGGTHPATELPAATALLTGLYNRAQADYQAAPPGPGLVLNGVGSVDKPTYNNGAQLEVNRKTGQSRTNVEFLGGTIVAGFWNGNDWEFHWQTFGGVEYDRPKRAHWRPGKAKHQDASTAVIGHGRIY